MSVILCKLVNYETVFLYKLANLCKPVKCTYDAIACDPVCFLCNLMILWCEPLDPLDDTARSGTRVPSCGTNTWMDTTQSLA